MNIEEQLKLKKENTKLKAKIARDAKILQEVKDKNIMVLINDIIDLKKSIKPLMEENSSLTNSLKASLRANQEMQIILDKTKVDYKELESLKKMLFVKKC